MVKKLFWDNPYATQLETQIASISNNRVTLEETIFYAFSGGQESDKGVIAGRTVLDAEKDGLEIVYTLESTDALSAGDTVKVDIDWERRYKLMRLHFAAEIILELTSQILEGIEKTGAHISEDKSRIDFLWQDNISPLLPEIEQKANHLINENHVIISAFSDELNQRRYWQIEGFAQVACGGTHIKTTGEVGTIKLKRKNVGRGKERVEIFL